MRVAQLAINSISTRHRDLEEALAAYAAAGFRNVEFHLPLVKDWLVRGHTVADVRRLLEAHNLRSIGGFELGVQCFSASAAQRENHAAHRFFSIELFNEELWGLPASEAACRCYASLLPLCTSDDFVYGIRGEA